MPLKYYSVIPDSKTPYNEHRDNLQATIDDIFTDSSTLYTLGQEIVVGTQTYVDLQVRLVQATNNVTGRKLGDDFKKIIFKDGTSNPILGKRYSFENNIWLTINTNNYTHPTYNSTIARCNTTMNWLLDNCSIHKEPIALDYDLSSTGVMAKTKIDVANGDLQGIVQANEFTRKIKVNDEFIFGVEGSLIKYKVKAMNSYINQETFVEDPKLIFIDFMVYEKNIYEDNIVDRVAQPIPICTIEIDQDDLSQTVGYTTQLTATIKEDDTIVEKDVQWSSSDASTVSVDANGNINLLQIGSATITVELDGNPLINDSIVVDVSASPIDNFEVRIEPNVVELLQGKTQAYSAYLYNNNVQQVDVFSISASNVPNDNYNLNIIDGNNFEVENIKLYEDNKLEVTCQSGANIGTIEIELKGLW